MNLLFLLSSLEPAGSETYCVALANAWEQKHRIFWISDRLHYGQTYTSLPISAKIFPRGLHNVWRVVRFIRENKIDLVHSHSRRSHWVASRASQLAGIKHVATVHQPPPVHFFSKLEPCLGDATIAVSEDARDHVLKYFRVKPDRVHLIRNGIQISPAPPPPRPLASSPPRILLLGRLTGHRWEAYQFFIGVLQRVGAHLPAATYLVSGRIPEERRAFMEKQVADLNARIAPSSVELAGWATDLPKLIDSVDVVVGAGRSAMESLAKEKPLIVLGERVVIGLCGPDQWAFCQRTNFGDHSPVNEFYPARLEVALREVLDPALDKTALGRWGREQVIRDYNLEHIADHIENVYKDVIASVTRHLATSQ